MPINVSNTTRSLATALKDVQGLEPFEARKKDKEPPAQIIAKAVVVFISTNAKIQVLKDSLL